MLYSFDSLFMPLFIVNYVVITFDVRIVPDNLFEYACKGCKSMRTLENVVKHNALNKTGISTTIKVALRMALDFSLAVTSLSTISFCVY